MTEGKKIGIACAIGGAVGTVVALIVAAPFWWLGLLAGFSGGYVSYEFRAVLRAIPQAWRITTQPTATASVHTSVVIALALIVGIVTTVITPRREAVATEPLRYSMRVLVGICRSFSPPDPANNTQCGFLTAFRLIHPEADFSTLELLVTSKPQEPAVLIAEFSYEQLWKPYVARFECKTDIVVTKHPLADNEVDVMVHTPNLYDQGTILMGRAEAILTAHDACMGFFRQLFTDGKNKRVRVYKG